MPCEDLRVKLAQVTARSGLADALEQISLRRIVGAFLRNFGTAPAISYVPACSGSQVKGDADGKLSFRRKAERGLAAEFRA